MNPLWMGAVHCSACTGRDRRREVYRVVRNAGGEVLLWNGQRLKDADGYIDHSRPFECPKHGPLRLDDPKTLVDDIVESFRQTRKFQHRTAPPRDAQR